MHNPSLSIKELQAAGRAVPPNPLSNQRVRRLVMTDRLYPVKASYSPFALPARGGPTRTRVGLRKAKQKKRLVPRGVAGMCQREINGGGHIASGFCHVL